MPSVRNLFFAAFLFVQGCLIGSATGAEVVTEQANVVVFGNRSLKPDTVIRMSGLYQDPRLDPHEVKQRLQTTNAFSSVEVLRDGDMVTIYVREKTTWFVVPYFSRDAAASTVGVAFGKSTFFGQDANIVGRFQVGTGNREASLLARDETLLDTPWLVGASLDYEDALHRVFRGREVVHRTLNQYHGGSLQLGYRVTSHLSLSLNNYVERHRFEELSGEYFSGLQWSHRLIAEFSRFYVNEGLSDGESVKAYFEKTNPIGTFQFWKVGVGLQAGLFHEGNFNWILRARTEYGVALPRYQLFEIGGGKLRGFPAQQFRDNVFGLVQNDVLLTSANFWMLRFRPLVYGDWAFIENSGRTAAGVGFQVYVKDIAIPAIQFYVGYGFNPNGFAASAAIGPQI